VDVGKKKVKVYRDRGERAMEGMRGAETYSTFHRWRPYT